MLDVTASGGTSAGHFATSAAGDVAHGGNPITVTGGYWAKGQQVTNLVMVPVDGGPAVLENACPGSAYFTASVVGYYVTLDSAGRPGVPAGDAAAAGHGHHHGQAVRHAGGHRQGRHTRDRHHRRGRQPHRLPGHRSGTITAYADDTPLPVPMNVSYAPGVSIADAAIVTVGKDGAIRLYNSGSRTVAVNVDLTGSYYAYP